MLKGLLAMSAALVLAACGSSGTSGSSTKPGAKLVQAQVCIGCHASATSPGTGASIVAEWKASVHNTKDGAGCADCHEPQNHPNNYCSSCHNGGQTTGIDEIQRNPDNAGKCLKCHSADFFPHGADNPDVVAGVQVNTQTAHFNNQTSAGNPGYPPSYVTYEYTNPKTGKANNCRKCHNPHDPSTAINYNRDFASGAHGMTRRLPPITLVPSDAGSSGVLTPATVYYDSRMSARGVGSEAFDFKTAGSFEPANVGLSDNSSGASRGCIRCHTTTGFINNVKSGFLDVTPFGPLNPATGRPYMKDQKLGSAPFSSGKEVTGCNACHDNGSGTAYDFRNLRKVAPATVYYNYSSKVGVAIDGKITNYKFTYPDAGDSNMCIPCHSGRLLGLSIKMASVRNLDFTKAAFLRSHYRGTAQLVYQTGGFEFYSSTALYYGAGDPAYRYSHVDIGMNRLPTFQTWEASRGIAGLTPGANAGDKRGHGPCIGCHMNSKGNDTSSHTFLPVNREAGANYRPGYPWQDDPARRPDPISKVVSNACAACHSAGAGWKPQDLQYEKTKYAAAATALREVLLFAMHTVPAKRTFDQEGRPAAPVNWYGVKLDGSSLGAPGTVDQIQKWLRSSTPQSGDLAGLLPVFVAGGEFRYPVVAGDKFSNTLQPVQSAAYNMGTYYNHWMMYSDPGGFAHNDVYAKRLIYDALDWLDNGKLDRSVKATFNGVLTNPENAQDTLNLKSKLGATMWQDAYTYLLTNNGVDNPGRPVP